jgi:GNAT superfamily N-acetyltransferase
MEIRAARPADAIAACRVVRRSIAELCQPDHHDDPAILQRWLGNKTPENFTTWIANPHSHTFVAVENESVVGVAGMNSSGEITLNYVSPDARFRGVSKALLVRLEAKAAELGHTRCILTSTLTARQLYQSAGYKDDGPPTSGFFTRESRRMTKPLPHPRRPQPRNPPELRAPIIE